MVIALTIVSLVWVAWLVHDIKPESFRLSAYCYKIGFKIELKSPPRGNAEGD